VATDRRTTLRRRLVVAVASAGLVGVAALVAPLPAAQAEVTGNVQFTGHGWGHGRGLGQYGAYGYATNQGWPYTQILSHYYGGTTLSTEPESPITVNLTSRGGADLLVTSGRDFTVGGLLVGGGSAARIQARPDGSFVLSTSYGCASPAVWTTTITDSRVVPTVEPGNDLQAMLSICTPTGTAQYRGELSAVWADGAQRVVNRVRMEDYLRGVVPRESPASWGDAAGGKGLEALKAQAVSARSYSYAESRSTWAQTCDTTACQVYGGAGVNYTTQEDRRTDAAVAATAHVVLRSSLGLIARAEFSSSTGGYTAGGVFPAVPDDGDIVSPYHDWTAAVPATTIASAFGVGALTDIRVTQRNGLGADGGRATTVVVTGTTKRVTVTGDAVRSALGLKSDWFSVTVAPAAGPAPTPAPVQPTVFRASGNVVGASADAVPFGQPGDIPLACDWNGDGVATLGVFRAGVFFITNTPGSGTAEVTFAFGQRGDQPVCGDWDGNGTQTVGLFRNGTVFLRNSNDTGIADGSFPFGDRGDTLVAGNWDGDQYDSVGVWRRGVFYLANSNLRPVANMVVPYGAATDLPTVGDWDGNGTDTIGVYRRDTFYVRNSNTVGAADSVLGFGASGDRPLPGIWRAGGGDVIGVARGY
jgi:SpoIID/LytB domain protein